MTRYHRFVSGTRARVTTGCESTESVAGFSLSMANRKSWPHTWTVPCARLGTNFASRSLKSADFARAASTIAWIGCVWAHRPAAAAKHRRIDFFMEADYIEGRRRLPTAWQRL